MRPSAPTAAILVAGLLLAVAPSVGLTAAGPSHGGLADLPTLARTTPAVSAAPAPPTGELRAGTPVADSAFGAHVVSLLHAAAAAGAPAERLGLPYLGTPARIVNGVVEPGYAVQRAADGSSSPDPQGVAYYGESDPSGTVVPTTVQAASLAGQVTIDQLRTLYFDTNTPQISGIQLNAILTGVTLQGGGAYDFWTQNALDYDAGNSTLTLGEDTWNMSTPTAYVPYGGSTIAAHSPNGSDVGGLYIGLGPVLSAPRPFNLTLFLNSSLASGGDQELWFNYTLAAAGQPFERGNYDWIVFNSTNAGHPATPPVASFEASGNHVSPVGLPFDYEMDVGIGGFNGATMDVLAANLTESLDYCPAAEFPCTPGDLTPVPAALDYGAQTGETGLGLDFTFHGELATATAGPGTARGLWGYAGLSGQSSGATRVLNDLTVSGSPVPAASAPYLFVFLEETSLAGTTTYGWAPDVPEWYLAPGTYAYAVLLADYAEVTGNLTVAPGVPTALSATLDYDAQAGVYSPLWALNDSEVAGLSSAGSGTLDDQYVLFNNPTADCTACGNAPNGNLSGAFFWNLNDYLYPSFPGLLLANTSAYVDVEDPVSFCAAWETAEITPSTHWYFDLPLDLYRTSHVTVRDATIGGWPTMFPIIMLAEVSPAQNPFPQADLEIWDSSGDLVMEDRFVGSIAANLTGPSYGQIPPLDCGICTSEDELLLYGGSSNTVWGNQFEDPNGASPCASGCAEYAGVAEAESGDLLYNNNLSVDNPTMYMAYDIQNDSCWAGYAGDCPNPLLPTYDDAWNVTNQSADAVSDTVNGFALSGSIVGPSYPYQGGNFWWNYGNPLNPPGSLPYVDVFDYTYYATNLPSGSVADEPSLRAGGDYLPEPAPAPTGSNVLEFRAVGLAPGLTWHISLPGVPPRTASDTTTGHGAHGKGSVTVRAASGTVEFSVQPPVGYGLARATGAGEPTLGASVDTVTVSGPTTVVDLHFGALETLTFEERVAGSRWPGAPPGSVWSVTLSAPATGGWAPAPGSASTNGSSISFTLAKGARVTFVLTPPSGYRGAPGHGTMTQPGKDHTRFVRFRPDPPAGGGRTLPGGFGIVPLVGVAGVAAAGRRRTGAPAASA